MRSVLLAILLALAPALPGCVSSGASSAASTANQKMEAQGLPFRYSAQSTGDGDILVLRMLPLPVGATRFDEPLRGEVLGAIRQREQGKGRSGADVQDVHNLADGREVWVMQSLLQGVAYVVGVRKAAQDVTKVELLGPYEFER